MITISIDAEAWCRGLSDEELMELASVVNNALAERLPGFREAMERMKQNGEAQRVAGLYLSKKQ